MEMMSETYRVELRGGGFAVYEKKPRTVRETTFADGVRQTVERPYREFFGLGADPSIFDGYYRKEWELWQVDIDCGAQRYNTCKSDAQMRAAFRKCGFTKEQVREIFQNCKGNTT